MSKEELATLFINAIKELANKPNNLENLGFYLENHFDVWMEMYANTPEKLVSELNSFAKMEI